MYRSISPSGTLLLNEQSAALKRTGKDVFHFGFGQSPFPVPTIMAEALQSYAHRKEYTPVQGVPALCKAAALFHTQHDHHNITEDRVLIAPGSKSHLYTIMMAFEKAHIFIPAPAWVSYAPQAQLVGHSITMLKTTYKEKYRVTADTLEKALSKESNPDITKLVILNYPGNPDGMCYTPEELKAMTAILRKHNAYILSDEIYGLLHFKGEHHSIAKFYPEKTFVTTGLSKWAGAGGWRLGVCILPEDYDPALKTTMLAIASETYSCAPAPMQHAAITAYSHPDIMDFVEKERIILKEISQAVYKKLCEVGIRTHPSEGGFYMLVDFSAYKDAIFAQGIITDYALFSTILHETGAALLAGTAFGLETSLLAARLAYVDFDGSAALKDFDEQGHWSDALTAKYAQKMILGIERIGDFLQNIQKNAKKSQSLLSEAI